jgi:hypothetical protein
MKKSRTVYHNPNRPRQTAYRAAFARHTRIDRFDFDWPRIVRRRAFYRQNTQK